MRRLLLVVAALGLAACPGEAAKEPATAAAAVPVTEPGVVTDPDLAELLRSLAASVEETTDEDERAGRLATLGMAYQANSFDALAAECYRRALERLSGDPRIWYHLAFVLERRDRYDEAVAAARRADALDPTYAPMHRSLAFWALARGRLDEAETAARRAVELSDGGAGALAALGRVELERGRPEAALATFERALANWPEDWGDAGYLHFLRGEALRNLGRDAEAAPELARARGEPTPFPDPWRAAVAGFRAGFEADLKRARHLLDAGRAVEAAAAYEELRARRPAHRQVLSDLASAYLLAARYREAAAVLASCVAAHPDALEARLQLARALWASGQRDDAFRVADESVRANPASADALLARAVLRLRAGRADDALADLAPAARIDPRSATVAAITGAAHLARGRDADARAAFESARALDAGQTTAAAGLALLAVRAGDLTGADRLLAPFADRPDSAALLLAEARQARAAARR